RGEDCYQYRFAPHLALGKNQVWSASGTPCMADSGRRAEHSADGTVCKGNETFLAGLTCHREYNLCCRRASCRARLHPLQFPRLLLHRLNRRSLRVRKMNSTLARNTARQKRTCHPPELWLSAWQPWW